MRTNDEVAALLEEYADRHRAARLAHPGRRHQHTAAGPAGPLPAQAPLPLGNPEAAPCWFTRRPMLAGRTPPARGQAGRAPRRESALRGPPSRDSTVLM